MQTVAHFDAVGLVLKNDVGNFDGVLCVQNLQVGLPPQALNALHLRCLSLKLLHDLFEIKLEPLAAPVFGLPAHGVGVEPGQIADQRIPSDGASREGSVAEGRRLQIVPKLLCGLCVQAVNVRPRHWRVLCQHAMAGAACLQEQQSQARQELAHAVTTEAHRLNLSCLRFKAQGWPVDWG